MARTPFHLRPPCRRVSERSHGSLRLSVTCPNSPCGQLALATRGASIRRLLPRTSTQVPTSRCVAILVEKLAFFASIECDGVSRRSSPRRRARRFFNLFVVRMALVERFLLVRAPSGRTLDTPVAPSYRTSARTLCGRPRELSRKRLGRFKTRRRETANHLRPGVPSAVPETCHSNRQFF
jgi:hypothetical protein